MITITQRTVAPEVTVLTVEGRITLGRSAQELEWKVDELLKAETKRVVFDLAGVGFLDSTGIGIIVMCAGKLKASGGSLRISGAKGVVQQTLHMCRVTDIVPVFASVEEAASSFGAAAGGAA